MLLTRSFLDYTPHRKLHLPRYSSVKLSVNTLHSVLLARADVAMAGANRACFYVCAIV